MEIDIKTDGYNLILKVEISIDRRSLKTVNLSTQTVLKVLCVCACVTNMHQMKYLNI